MDYEKEYKSLIARLTAFIDIQPPTTKSALEDIFPDVVESEDKRIMDKIYVIAYNALEKGEISCDENSKICGWLLRQKSKKQWKPSKEQMELLEEVQKELLGKDCHNRFTGFIYDLKKL